MELVAQARERFRQVFGGEATRAAQAPGRVELLGNHTDYNGGLVMSAAIDRRTVVVGAKIPEPVARVHSVAFDAHDCFDPRALDSPGEGWQRYVRGVAAALAREADNPVGFACVITGDIPPGAGLSSSASLEAALACFLGGLWGVPTITTDTDRLALARVLQRVENEAVGVACGLLDQFSVLMGRAGHALWLDCADESFGRVSLGPEPPAIVVCDSQTSRRLAEGQYNTRRAECERVAAHYAAQYGRPIRRLRDVSLQDLEAEWDRLDPVARRRARHVATENERVRAGIAALQAGDVAQLGALMSASHRSSRDDFENSSPALDALVEAAQTAPGFLGGKLSGAGWAGCTVNLVKSGEARRFADHLRRDYSARLGVEPVIHIGHAADGANTWSLTDALAGEFA